MFGRQQVGTRKEGIEHATNHRVRLVGHSQHAVVPIDVIAQVTLQLQVLRACCVAETYQACWLPAYFIDIRGRCFGYWQ